MYNYIDSLVNYILNLSNNFFDFNLSNNIFGIKPDEDILEDY
jgi:hypothetical protein